MIILREKTIFLQMELCQSLWIWSNGKIDLFKEQNLELAEWNQSMQRPSVWYIHKTSIHSKAEKDEELLRGVTHNKKSMQRPNAFPEGKDTNVPEEHWLLLVQVLWHCCGNAYSYTPYTPEKKVRKVYRPNLQQRIRVRHSSQKYFYRTDGW